MSLVALANKIQSNTASSMAQLKQILTAKPFVQKAWYPHYAFQDLYFGLTLFSTWGLECLLAVGFISYTSGVHVLV